MSTYSINPIYDRLKDKGKRIEFVFTACKSAAANIEMQQLYLRIASFATPIIEEEIFTIRDEYVVPHKSGRYVITHEMVKNLSELHRDMYVQLYNTARFFEFSFSLYNHKLIVAISKNGTRMKVILDAELSVEKQTELATVGFVHLPRTNRWYNNIEKGAFVNPQRAYELILTLRSVIESPTQWKKREY